MYHSEIIKGQSIGYNAYCGHPEMQGNSTASVGCGGNCQSCKRCKVELNAVDFLKLLDCVKEVSE